MTYQPQILSITCDNVSNNNIMITELADLVDNFPGAANQTCCFLHVINLIVKSIIKPKAKANGILDKATKKRR